MSEHIVDKLGVNLAPSLPGLVLSLFPGMEETGTEMFDKVYEFLNHVEESTTTTTTTTGTGSDDTSSAHLFFRAVFEGLLLCPQLRMGGFNYLNERIVKQGLPGFYTVSLSLSFYLCVCVCARFH